MTAAALADALVHCGPAHDYYGTPAWYQTFAATCLDPGDRVVVAPLDGAAGSVVLVLRERADRIGPVRGRRLASLTNFYSCGFRPAGLAEADDPAALVADWARRQRRYTRLQFEALDDDHRGYHGLVDGLRRAGFWVEGFRQFGNWYVDLARYDGCFERYWADRPGHLRQTVKRKSRALFRDHDTARIEVIATADQAERAIAAYEAVHAASWKPPEPYPAFMATLIRTGLKDGQVQLGLIWLDDRPLAAQVWVTWGRRATIFKLSYDDRRRNLSAGTILTHHMIGAALRSGRLDEIDFGWGDDRYKRDWLPLRRQRWGLNAYNPRHPIGFALGLRHLGPRLFKRRRSS